MRQHMPPRPRGVEVPLLPLRAGKWRFLHVFVYYVVLLGFLYTFVFLFPLGQLLWERLEFYSETTLNDFFFFFFIVMCVVPVHHDNKEKEQKSSEIVAKQIFKRSHESWPEQ